MWCMILSFLPLLLGLKYFLNIIDDFHEHCACLISYLSSSFFFILDGGGRASKSIEDRGYLNLLTYYSTLRKTTNKILFPFFFKEKTSDKRLGKHWIRYLVMLFHVSTFNRKKSKMSTILVIIYTQINDFHFWNYNNIQS